METQPPSENEFEPETMKRYVEEYGYFLISSSDRRVISIVQVVLIILAIWMIYKGTVNLFCKPIKKK